MTWSVSFIPLVHLLVQRIEMSAWLHWESLESALQPESLMRGGQAIR
jgi:hypothetical protein